MIVMVKETAWKWIDDHRDRLTEISDEIQGYAEYGLCEDKSSEFFAEKLKIDSGSSFHPSASYGVRAT